MLKYAHTTICIVIFFLSTQLYTQTVLINEGFSSGSLPAGWSNENNGGTAGQIWEFNDPGTRSISAGNFTGSNYAILDSDNYGSGTNNQNARLITPTFSTGIFETIILEFDYQYREYNGPESCVVEVFNGTTWTEVFRKEIGDENYTGANFESIDITSEVGAASNAQVRFVYIGAYDWWWAIDNVKVTGTTFSSSNAYLGPGGVGNTDGVSNLVLWTNPEGLGAASNLDPIETWSDNSGYGSDFTQPNSDLRPFLVENFVNGYNVIRFDATAAANALQGKRLVKTAFTNFPTSDISGFYVNKNADSSDGVLSYASSAHNNDFLIFNSNNLSMYRSSNVSTGLDANSNVWNIVGFRRSSSGDARMSLNGNSGYSGTLSSGNSITSGGSLALAGEQDSVDIFGTGNDDGNYSAAQAHQGDFSEVILFNSFISEAERIIVSNYLSAKYNINLSANDFYNEDTSGGDFDHNVAGIGRASDGSTHLDSQGTGIIRINTPSDLNNDEFLFWGEDVKDADYVFSSSLSTNYLERLDTKWRVSKRNNLGTVSIAVKASDLTLNSPDGCNDLKLIVSNSSTFATKTTYDLTLSSGIYTATGVSFNDNDYFTIEYIDTIVLDGATAYNGSGISNKPNTLNDCFRMLVKTNTVTLSENGDVREVEIESGGILAINSGFKLKIIKGINNEGDIRLVGTSQLVQTHAGANINTGSGNLFVDQTASTSSVYHSGYWTSPVSSSGASFTIASVLKDGAIPTAATATAGEAADINFTGAFDGNAGSTPIQISTRWLAKLIDAADWTRFLNPHGSSFSPGEGWNMKSLGATFTFKGKPNSGTYSVPISQDNFSLIGNPYPSSLDSELFITDNLSAINGTLYLYNSASDNTHVRNSYTGTYSTIVSGVTVGGGRYLPVGQAFFVTRDAVGTGTITFQNSQRLNIDIVDTAPILARSNKKSKIKQAVKKDNNYPVLRLGFEFDVATDFTYKRQLAVAFRGLTAAYENGYDGEMLYKRPSDVSLKISNSVSPFVISSIDDFNEDIEIPLHLNLDLDRKVKFKIDQLENFDDVSIYLNDRLNNTFYNLSKEDILLDVNQGEYSDRFFITFKYELLDDDTYEYNYVKLYRNSNSNSIVIRKADPIHIEKMEVFDINGKLIFEDDVEHQKNKIEFLLKRSFTTGVYIVKLTTDKGDISQKLTF